VWTEGISTIVITANVGFSAAKTISMDLPEMVSLCQQTRVHDLLTYMHRKREPTTTALRNLLSQFDWQTKKDSKGKSLRITYLIISRLYIFASEKNKKPKGISTPCTALPYHTIRTKTCVHPRFFFLACGPPVFFRRPPSSPMLMSFRKLKPVQTFTRTFFFTPSQNLRATRARKRAGPGSSKLYPVYLYSQSKTSSVSRPPVVAEDFSATHLAFAKVLGDAAAYLRKGGAHDFAEVSL
jgi:hypothetical protein